jgi:hypothetical protein
LEAANQDWKQQTRLGSSKPGLEAGILPFGFLFFKPEIN